MRKLVTEIKAVLWLFLDESEHVDESILISVEFSICKICLFVLTTHWQHNVCDESTSQCVSTTDKAATKWHETAVKLEWHENSKKKKKRTIKVELIFQERGKYTFAWWENHNDLTHQKGETRKQSFFYRLKIKTLNSRGKTQFSFFDFNPHSVPTQDHVVRSNHQLKLWSNKLDDTRLVYLEIILFFAATLFTLSCHFEQIYFWWW